MSLEIGSNIRVYDKLYINGEWVKPNSGKLFDSYNPSTGRVWAQVAEGDETDIDRAVEAAKKAFRKDSPWRKMTATQRGHLIRKLADLIRSKADYFAELETMDNGKALRETRLAEMANIPEWYYYYAGMADKIRGEHLPLTATAYNITVKEPIGVVGAIIPWNSPMLMAAFKLGPALAAGCTVVLKPAEQTPVTCMELAKLIDEAGFPPGVVNVVPGFGPTAGAALAKHPDVAKVAFTGEHITAIEIMKNAADNLKKVSFECGGKAPFIIFDDANLEQAVVQACAGVFVAGGQTCAAGSRIFIHKNKFEPFVEALLKKANSIRVGNPLELSTQMGAQTSLEQLNKIKRYVQYAREEGGEILCGGVQPDIKGFESGYFFTPTVIANVKNNYRVCQEEIFGPVTAVMSFEDEEEVIQLANDVKYGLTAGIYTNDIRKANRVADRLDAGMVWINNYRKFHYGVAYGGYKISGIGRENGFQAIDLFTQDKCIMIENSETFVDPYAN